MTTGPARPPPGADPGLRAASVCLFAYLTPRGEPLCWPVTPFWDPERGILAIATGLAYPAKADYAARNPRVAALFPGARHGDLLLRGRAAVLAGDLQANTDRYVRELRAKFPAARIGLNPLTVPFLGFYLPRLWIEVTPERWTVPSPAPADPLGAGGGVGIGAADAAALEAWVRREGRAAVAVRAADRYPAISTAAAEPAGGGRVRLASAPATGPAALTLHRRDLAGVRLDALMARGEVVAAADGFVFLPRRVVGFLGRDPTRPPALLGIFPLSQIPRVPELRERVRRELARRGLPMPRLRVPGPDA